MPPPSFDDVSTASSADMSPPSSTDMSPPSSTNMSPPSPADVLPSSPADVSPSTADVSPSISTDISPPSQADDSPLSSINVLPSSPNDLVPPSATDTFLHSSPDMPPTSETDTSLHSSADMPPTSETDSHHSSSQPVTSLTTIPSPNLDDLTPPAKLLPLPNDVNTCQPFISPSSSKPHIDSQADTPTPSPSSSPHTVQVPEPSTSQSPNDEQSTSPTTSFSNPGRSQRTIFVQRSNTSSSLLQLASVQTIAHLQKQLLSATITISSMQQEILTLKDQLAQATQQIEENTQHINNAEVRVKNTVKTVKQELSQKIQETRDEQKKLHSQIKETASKQQSFRDSQNNINTDIKKQLQTVNNVKHTRHSGNQTDNILSEDNTTHEYCLVTSNRFSALSDSNLTDPPTSTTIAKKTTQTKKAKQDNIEVSTKDTSIHSPTASNKRNPSLPTPLATLMQKTVPPSCDTLLLGDSVSERVEERSMSANGNKVRNLSVPGLTVHHLCQWLTSRPPSPHIRQVAIHVGINSCEKGPVSTTDWLKLISLLRQVFPSAVLKASSIIPPLGQHPLKEAASRSTANLRRSCLQEGIVYIDNTPCFLAKSGAPKKAMYQDRLHPSAQGYKLLAHNIHASFNGQRPYPAYRLLTSNGPPPRRGLTNHFSYVDALRRGGRSVENYPSTNHPKQSSPAATARGNSSVTESLPTQGSPPPIFHYNRDFPTTTLKNPNSQDVFNMLGQHQPSQPLNSNPQQIISLLAEMLKPFIK